MPYSYCMSGEDILRCVSWACYLTVEHILIECGDFTEVRQRYYAAILQNKCNICIGLLV